MSEINALGIVKSVVELAVSSGAGVVVGNLVRATTPDDLTKFQKITVAVGAYGIGVVLGDLTAKHVSSQIDNYAEKLDHLLHPEITDEELEELTRPAEPSKDED